MKNVLKNCAIWQSFHSGQCKAPAAPPQAKRSTESKPFEVTEVDYAGPLFDHQRYTQRDEREDKKVYICLFTFATTRAIHFELVEDLTTH